jgi:hypothetical protein
VSGHANLSNNNKIERSDRSIMNLFYMGSAIRIPSLPTAILLNCLDINRKINIIETKIKNCSSFADTKGRPKRKAGYQLLPFYYSLFFRMSTTARVPLCLLQWGIELHYLYHLKYNKLYNHYVLVFIVLVVALVIDLGLLSKRSAEITLKKAFTQTLFWVALAFGFFAFLWWRESDVIALEYLSAYLMEWSLSIDNILFSFLFSASLKYVPTMWPVPCSLVF